jgi:hypothetical protein
MRTILLSCIINGLVNRKCGFSTSNITIAVNRIPYSTALSLLCNFLNYVDELLISGDQVRFSVLNYERQVSLVFNWIEALIDSHFKMLSLSSATSDVSTIFVLNKLQEILSKMNGSVQNVEKLYGAWTHISRESKAVALNYQGHTTEALSTISGGSNASGPHGATYQVEILKIL